MKTGRTLEYNPKLDVLRAFAVVLVIIHHWIPNNKILNYFPNGMMGVTLFFVLSGYLITAILFRSNPSDINSSKKIKVIKVFMIRRALRIFPIYYMTLLILMFLNFKFLEEYWIYFITYTQNFLFHDLNYWPGPISHLWTLAVEEQYYLFWPFLVIFTKPKNYIKLLFTIIIVSLFSKVLLYLVYPDNKMNSLLLLPSLFSFGIGGVLAYVKLKGINLMSFKYIYSLFFLLITIFIFSVYFNFSFVRTELFVLVSTLIIYFLTLNNHRLVQRIFTLKPLIFIGKISYGLYLYHNFIPLFYSNLSVKYKETYLFNTIKVFPDILNPMQRLTWMTAILLLLSGLSFYLLEKPINKFKTKFNYE